MMDINNILNNFRLFLNSSFNIINKNALHFSNLEKEEYNNDWLQANWEMLVEKLLLKPNSFLEIYGEGAEINGGSSRVAFPDALPTHRILVKLKEDSFDLLNNTQINKNNHYIFDKFIGFANGYLSYNTPYEFVSVYDAKKNVNRIFSFELVYFELSELNK